jgi:hypothetical protein
MPLAEWQDTKATLHRFCQVVGKIRLTASVRRNHWWNLPFHLTGRGITTRPMDQPATQPGFAIDLDFVDQQLRIHTLDATPTPPSARLSCGDPCPERGASDSHPSGAVPGHLHRRQRPRSLQPGLEGHCQPQQRRLRNPRLRNPIGPLDSYRGRYVFHRHNLEHEDMQMMGNFQVT